MCSFRIGHGYDVHRLVEGRRLILGGVEIPHSTGCLGHSDADVLYHAIMDSLLGAMAMGDIGRHFPDSSDEYKDADSGVLMAEVVRMLRDKRGRVENIDATLILQRPRIAEYIPIMRDNIARILGVSQDRVNVKATTEERLGFTGREEGVSAHCVALITLDRSDSAR